MAKIMWNIFFNVLQKFISWSYPLNNSIKFSPFVTVCNYWFVFWTQRWSSFLGTVYLLFEVLLYWRVTVRSNWCWVVLWGLRVQPQSRVVEPVCGWTEVTWLMDQCQARFALQFLLPVLVYWPLFTQSSCHPQTYGSSSVWLLHRTAPGHLTLYEVSITQVSRCLNLYFISLQPIKVHRRFGRAYIEFPPLFNSFTPGSLWIKYSCL